LHCPVKDSGVAPGRQICLVSRWRLLSIVFRNTPCVRWLIPMVHSDIVAGERAKVKATSRMRSAETPTRSATFSGA
jgi:hypothetical protein